MKRILRTPIRNQDIEPLRIGDIVYLDGTLVTCRDVAHRRLIEYGMDLPVDLSGMAIFHAGPIVMRDGERWKMVSVGPTTSMRMEPFERDFIEKTGVKLIVGKGGMGKQTSEGCRRHKALHAVFPGGCAVLAATQIEEIERVEWQELGMPESLWVCRVREFGPLIISIDTTGDNLFERNRAVFKKRMQRGMEEIFQKVRYIR